MPDNDPFNLTEGTSIRPRPGRRGGSEPLRTRSAPSSFLESEPVPEPPRELLGIGLNPLVSAASPLLLLGGHLRGSVSPMDVEGLRRHALDEIRRFEEHARAAGVANEIVLAARYVLCAHLDEAVLSTPWGAQSEWAQHPLLVTLHREAWGGEKFFEMLDRVSADPAKYLDVMELQYLCLALGFGGKYQVQERGHERLAAVQQDLYRKIRSHRSAAPAELSLHWQGLQDRRNPLIRYVPWWVVGAAALAVLTIAFSIYHAKLAGDVAPVRAKLATIGIEDFSRPVAVPVRAPRLKTLIERDATVAREVKVTEDGARTVVTLVAPDLFASASATVNPKYEETLRHIASALNQVPGRISVEGHTDGQPIHTFRFTDNYDLSQERALGVVAILKQGLDNDGRISGKGFGPDRPIAAESDPANRSRNRRVEIVHVAGA